MLARENVGQTLLVILALSVGYSVGASETAYIRLQKSDYYKSTTNQSSFTNMLDKSYGWADPVNGNGAAPRSDADYLVDEGKVLCTPYENKSSTVWAFGGRSLVIDGSKLYVRTANTASLEFDDLVFRGASEMNNNTWSYNNTIYGKVSLDVGAELTLTPGGTGHNWFFECPFASAADATLLCTGQDAWLTNDKYSAVDFNGDCSRFLGTVKADLKITVSLKCTDGAFPGAIHLDRISTLALDETAEATAFDVGRVVSSNSTVTVPANRTLKVGVFVSGGTETNNVVTLGEGSVLEVGELTVDNTKFDLSDGGVMNLTGPVVATRPAVLVPPAASRSILVTMPVSAGQLKVSDFKTSSASYMLIVKTEGDVQRLYGVKRTFDASTGYVVLEKTEAANASIAGNKYAYDTDGVVDGKGWSDKDKPHLGTNYYSAVTIRTKNSVFKGDSLTVGENKNAVLRVASDFTINDLRMVGQSEWTTSGGSALRRCMGDSLSIVTTKAKPLTLTGGLNGQGYQIDSALHGNADAWISCKVASTTAVGDGRFTCVWLLGDNSDYAGTVWVDYQTTLALGSSMPGTVALGSTNETQAATLTTLAAADEVISVATLSSDVLGVVDVPPTNELRVVNGLSVAKVLNKTGLGTLAIGGSASAESGASFTVGEGALKPLSATAIGSLPVTFAAGTSVKLDWEPSDAAVAERGLDLSCSPFAVSGDALTFAFDYGDVKLEKKTFKKALVTVKDADAEKLAGKINVARIRGFNAQLLPPVSVGGETTCSVEFVPSGIVVIVK